MAPSEVDRMWNQYKSSATLRAYTQASWTNNYKGIVNTSVLRPIRISKLKRSGDKKALDFDQ